MKKVTFTYVCEFPDEMSDSDAIKCAKEIMGQDDDFSDSQFGIETIPNETKIDQKKVGLLRSVTYEKDGKLIQVEWAKLSKALLSNQICLITPDGMVLPIIRKGQL